MNNMNIRNTEEGIEFGEPSPELKEYMAELERSKKRSPRFAKLPYWIVDTGVLRVLKPNAVKLLINLSRRADWHTSIGRIGNKRISKESKIYKSSVPRGFKDLKRLGVIKTWRRGWPRYYKIQFSPPPDIEKRLEFYRKLDKSPRNTDTYLRDPKTGRFMKKVNSPKTSDVAYPRNTEPA